MSESRESITIRTDIETARLLRDVLYAQGERQAAGAPIPTLDRKDSELLGRFLSDLDKQLGGTGRMA